MKKYFSIIAFAASVISLTGCLKDDKANLQPNNSPAVVEWSTSVTKDAPISPSGSTYALYQRSYDIAPSVNTSFEVNYTGGSAAPEDITVNIGLKEDAIQQYNDERLSRDRVVSNLVLLPATDYVMPSSVVIKKGERKATVTLQIKSALITDFNTTFALPLSITSLSKGTISGNYGTIIVQTSVKNPYDGVYKFSGLATGSPQRTNVYQAGPFKWPGDVELRTSGPNTVDLYDAYYNFGGGLSQWLLLLPATATTGGGFGQARPRITIDLATNKVTAIVNAFPNPTNGRSFEIDPSYDNKYDPATKTLDIRFFFKQPTFVDLTVTYKFVFDSVR